MNTPRTKKAPGQDLDRSALRRRSSLKRATALGTGHPVFLSWIEEDIENRFVRGGRFTSPNKVFSLVIGAILTGAFYGFLLVLLNLVPTDGQDRAAVPVAQADQAGRAAGPTDSSGQGGGSWFQAAIQTFGVPFVRPGNVWTVVPGMLFFFWGMTTLFLKSAKIRFQERALNLTVVPNQPDFILNVNSAKEVLERLLAMVDHPRHFVLLNRIERALANLHHLGTVGDVSTILKTQAENDENQTASSYTLVSGMVWATPVLGFIGTVLGLSMAISSFTKTLQAGADTAKIRDSLQQVTGGLSTAFETTLVALVCALIMQLYINYLQHREAEFLDACNDYCHAHVVAKLRLTHRDAAPDAVPAPDSKPASAVEC